MAPDTALPFTNHATFGFCNPPSDLASVLKLRPEFKLGIGMTMIDWFEITEGAGFFCIRSGLRHADGQTKSPYHYEDCVGGKNAEKIAMEKFNKWWASLNVA